jgi:predicted nucleotidyltransferase component of viral defense system
VTTGFNDIIAASEADRRDLFLSTSMRLGTPIQNVEKDFWVCWVLDLLFNQAGDKEPRLLFKGGTSLSKSHGLISRFSEDIDITVFREDLGELLEVEELEVLSGKKQRARLNAIKSACQRYISSTLRTRLTTCIASAFEKANLTFNSSAVTLDPDDTDQQTLLIAYPTVSAQAGDYIAANVKIEAGAKSALDPHRATTVTPYLAEDVPHLALSVDNIVTIDAERTFWDKTVILHGQRRWFERRGELRRQGQRVSRHYYDVYRLLDSDVGQSAARDLDLARDCARHARMFFNCSDLDLATARPGMFALSPLPEMDAQLRRDYAAMTGMIFGEVPRWDAIVESIRQFEKQINQSEAFLSTVRPPM